VVLGDEEALVIGAGDDLDEDAAGSAIGVGGGEGVVVEGVLNGGEDGAIFVAGCGERGSRVNADVDVGGAEWESKSEEEGRGCDAMHGNECTAWIWGRGKHRSKNPLMAMGRHECSTQNIGAEDGI
jgi:hypothetical protein